MVRNRDLGFVKMRPRIAPTADTVINNHLETVKHELMKVDGVTSVAGSAQCPDSLPTMVCGD